MRKAIGECGILSGWAQEFALSSLALVRRVILDRRA